jgi:hypothetical protein
MAFISVDFPTFGRPAKQAKPDLNPGGTAWAGSRAGEGGCSDATP